MSYNQWQFPLNVPFAPVVVSILGTAGEPLPYVSIKTNATLRGSTIELCDTFSGGLPVWGLAMAPEDFEYCIKSNILIIRVTCAVGEAGAILTITAADEKQKLFFLTRRSGAGGGGGASLWTRNAAPTIPILIPATVTDGISILNNQIVTDRDAFGRDRILINPVNATWPAGGGLLKLGSFTADGDVADINHEGICVIGAASSGAFDGSNWSMARIKKDRLGIEESLAGVQKYIYRIDPTSFTMRNDAGATIYRITRATAKTGAFYTILNGGIDLVSTLNNAGLDNSAFQLESGATYTITGAITGNNKVIYGNKATINRNTGRILDNCSGLTFYDTRFIGSSLAGGQYVLTDVSDCIFYNCIFNIHTGDPGLGMSIKNNNVFYNCKFIFKQNLANDTAIANWTGGNNKFIGCTLDGLDPVGSEQVANGYFNDSTIGGDSFTECTFIRFGQSAVAPPLSIGACVRGNYGKNILINSCLFIDAHYGVQFNAVTSIENCVITDCIFQNLKSAYIDSGAVRGLIFTDNFIKQISAEAINATVAAYSKFEGNIIERTGNTGLYLIVLNGNDNSANDNKLRNSGGTDTAGISSAGSDNIVNDNNLRALNLNSTGNYNIVTGNNLRGGVLTASGTGTVSANNIT